MELKTIQELILEPRKYLEDYMCELANQPLKKIWKQMIYNENETVEDLYAKIFIYWIIYLKNLHKINKSLIMLYLKKIKIENIKIVKHNLFNN